MLKAGIGRASISRPLPVFLVQNMSIISMGLTSELLRENILYPLPHRQYVFSIPIILLHTASQNKARTK